MKASDDAPRERGSDEGWDETVLVWNATVARIPAPAATPPGPDEDVAAIEGRSAKPERGRRGGASG